MILPAVKEHYLGGDRKTAIEDFKKTAPLSPRTERFPSNRFRRTEIFIVCDMLLTGFDAPILQTMYLDKGLRDHTLLQAIARVNRPYKDIKDTGVVYDYFGMFEKLNTRSTSTRANWATSRIRSPRCANGSRNG